MVVFHFVTWVESLISLLLQITRPEIGQLEDAALVLDIRLVLHLGEFASSSLATDQLRQHDSVVLGLPLLLVF